MQVRARPCTYNLPGSIGRMRRFNFYRNTAWDHRPEGTSSQEQGDTLGEGTMESSYPEGGNVGIGS